MRFSHFFFFVSLLFALVWSSAAHFAPAAAHLPAAASPTSCGTRHAAPSPVPTTPSILVPIDSDSATPTTRPAKFLLSSRRPFAVLLLVALAIVAKHLLTISASAEVVEAAERVEMVKVVEAAESAKTVEVVEVFKAAESAEESAPWLMPGLAAYGIGSIALIANK
ncbi:hypothetical protein IW146_005018 [Coemansia sp. RSA 922]|nr:hypothetical protein H4S03_005469 [Coemansia sp. S3946]KAJ2049441.1 hypothetical protein H4S04_003221 [Coemansia sp. S16]KAJ2111900.1 hypothetical protein IW146_005018 [Coemansia sp. RSA 922]